MHWALYVLIGASVNVVVNWGYKFMGGKTDLLAVSSIVYFVGGIVLAIVSLLRGATLSTFIGETPWVPILMGLLSPIAVFFFVNALSKGPISLVDPMWACVYSLVSVAIGMMLLRENPSPAALAGVGLYLVGAFMMARG